MTPYFSTSRPFCIIPIVGFIYFLSPILSKYGLEIIFKNILPIVRIGEKQIIKIIHCAYSVLKICSRMIITMFSDHRSPNSRTQQCAPSSRIHIGIRERINKVRCLSDLYKLLRIGRQIRTTLIY